MRQLEIPRFQIQDYLPFLRATGDTNPLHTDPEHATKTPFGRVIVPGMYILLRAEGVLPSNPGTFLLDFQESVSLSDRVTISYDEETSYFAVKKWNAGMPSVAVHGVVKPEHGNPRTPLADISPLPGSPLHASCLAEEFLLQQDGNGHRRVPLGLLLSYLSPTLLNFYHGNLVGAYRRLEGAVLGSLHALSPGEEIQGRAQLRKQRGKWHFLDYELSDHVGPRIIGQATLLEL
ncbi:MaoC family dehydratase [Candidatus Woesearchaeota archaeon]|nr:MaoC family dehydratase [Candidatus Woesearchaeota archaeon]